MRTLSDLLALGLSVLLHSAEKDDVGADPGPARARLFKVPHRENEFVLVASRETIEEALDELLSVPDELLAKVGTPYVEPALDSLLRLPRPGERGHNL